jgi:hypothetical protein
MGDDIDRAAPVEARSAASSAAIAPAVATFDWAVL